MVVLQWFPRLNLRALLTLLSDSSDLLGPVGVSGVMGSSPMSSGAPSSTSLPHQSPIQQSSPNAGDSVPILPRVHHNGDRDPEHRKLWMPKMDFPCFDGSDVRIWLDKCSAYFQLYAIPPDFRVTTASLHMVGKASHWYQSYKHSAGYHTWEHFVVAMSRSLN
jgi:hypothetical protein